MKLGQHNACIKCINAFLDELTLLQLVTPTMMLTFRMLACYLALGTLIKLTQAQEKNTPVTGVSDSTEVF